MHIALVRREMTLHRSGAERMCVNLLRYLVQQGHRVTVIAERFDEDLRDGAEFLPIPKTIWSGWRRTQAFALRAEKMLRQHAFDHVHGLARLRGLDTFHALDPIHTHWIRIQYPQLWQSGLQSWNPRHRSILDLEKQIYSSAGPRRIIVQSPFDRDLLQTHFDVSDSRITVISNGVDLQEFSITLRDQRDQTRQQLGISPERPLILFAGMDFRRKGLDTLIQSIPFLMNPRALVLVAGQGPIEKYAAYAKQFGVENKIRFLGQVAEMAQLYAAADVLALPTKYDPFASVVLESLACGTPVVTSYCGGGAMAIQEPSTGAVLNDPLNAQELAHQLNAQLLITEDRTHACAQRAQLFTAESYAQQTLSVLSAEARKKAA